jgi:carbamoyltransferase
MNSKILAINGYHDASVTFVDRNDQIRIFEYERFCKKRYGVYRQRDDNTSIGTNEEIRNRFLNYIKIHLKEKPKTILYTELDYEDIEYLKKHFPNTEFFRMGHHMSHCAGAYFESGFVNALAISLDGGGLDYQSGNDLALRSYSVYKFMNGESETIAHTNFNRGEYVFNPGIYGAFGYYVSEIKKECDDNGKSQKNALPYAGKIMGLAAYGKVRDEWIPAITNFYKYHPVDHWTQYDSIENKLINEIGIDLFENCFKGQDSYDLAATNQHVFEELCFEYVKPFIEKYNLDVVFSGGCALNVLFNQKLAEYLNSKNLKLYVPPYPGDCGLSFGHIVSFTSTRCKPSVYCGIDIMDRDKLIDYYDVYHSKNKVKFYQIGDIIDLIKDGKIGGVIQGYSEVGPRALGNRSIICDPSIADMKDILNAKVKFREWFRPFAPVCREEDKNIYFENPYPSEYMSYAPKVREEYQSLLPAITHEDGTARLQTVTKDQHSLFYDILTELNKRNHISVIMNTSFNIKGKPILTTLEDAFYVLENTELDFLIVENFLFTK